MQPPSSPSGEWYWRILLENSSFSPPCTCLTPHSGWTPCDINITYTWLKNEFNGLQFRRSQYGSIFIRLAVIACKTREMLQNSKRASILNLTLQQFIDLGVKSMESPYVTSYYSLIVTLAVSVFEIFRLKDRKPLILPTPPLFDTDPFEFCDEIWRQKTRIVGLPDSEEINDTIPGRDRRTDRQTRWCRKDPR